MRSRKDHVDEILRGGNLRARGYRREVGEKKITEDAVRVVRRVSRVHAVRARLRGYRKGRPWKRVGLRLLPGGRKEGGGGGVLAHFLELRGGGEVVGSRTEVIFLKLYCMEAMAAAEKASCLFRKTLAPLEGWRGRGLAVNHDGAVFCTSRNKDWRMTAAAAFDV